MPYNKGQKGKHFSAWIFNLEVLAPRLRIMLAILNLCLLFPAIADECSASGRNEYRNIRRSNGVVVRVSTAFVEKIFPSADGFDQLEHIYDIMKVAAVPNVEQLIKLKRSTKTATFEPRGMLLPFGTPLTLLLSYIVKQ